MHACMCCYVLLCVGGIRDVIRMMLRWSLSMESMLVWCASFGLLLCALVCCLCLILCVVCVCDLCCCMCLCVCNVLFVCL